MAYQQIQYIEPLSKSWERMKQALFSPFSLGKWFVLGFSAFLANPLMGGGSNYSSTSDMDFKQPLNVADIPGRVLDWLMSHPVLTALILAGILAGIIIVLVITWLRSRGAFIFLDNVVNDRALIVNPWHRYRAAGKSLFLWRIGFGIVTFLLMLPVLVLTYFLILRLFHSHSITENLNSIMIISLLWLVLSIAAGYVSMLVNSFVVPVMYMHDLGVMQAWRKFFPILSSHFFHFILYGLFRLLLLIAVGIAIFAGGCLTCCIGLLLMSIPYISSVVLLPVSFVFRTFSLEFLAQWGPEFSVFPETPPESSMEFEF